VWPRLVRRWEALPGAAQFWVALPIFTAVLWWGHVALLNQPVGRGLVYGLFWGALLALGLVWASTNEARRRHAGEQGQDGREDP
jgi:hypothetical protein